MFDPTFASWRDQPSRKVSHRPLFERVAAGAARLDKAYPHWWDWIPTDQIDMSSCSCCILGHLYGSYSKGIVEVLAADWLWEQPLGHAITAMSRLSDKVVAHGFTSETRSNAECERLRLAWIDEIEQRLSRSAQKEKEHYREPERIE